MIERTVSIAKLIGLATAIIVVILCLSYDNAYGLPSAMNFQKPKISSGPGATNPGTPQVNDTDNWNAFLDELDNDGQQYGGDQPATTVPEPTTLLLMGAGLAMAARMRKRS